MDALTRLVDLLAEQRDYRPAIGYGQQLLQLDPCNETTYCRLMRLHAHDGDRAGMARASIRLV